MKIIIFLTLMAMGMDIDHAFNSQGANKCLALGAKDVSVGRHLMSLLKNGADAVSGRINDMTAELIHHDLYNSTKLNEKNGKEKDYCCRADNDDDGCSIRTYLCRQSR